MHNVNAKRLVIFPKELCGKAGISPGDRAELFKHEGRIALIKQEVDVSAGVLKHLKGNLAFSGGESLPDLIKKKCL